MNRRTDDVLLREYATSRSDESFRELALRHGPLVYGACLRRLKRPELAEDAAQAVFLVLAQKAGRIHVRTTLVPWLLKTAKLICWRLARAEARRSHHEIPLDEEITASDAVDVALFEALDRLNSAEREAVVLRFVQGLSLAEVGEELGVSEDAARMRVQRGLARLRQRLAPSLATPASLIERLSHPELASANLHRLASGATTKMTIALPIAAVGVASLCGVTVLLGHAAHSSAPRPQTRSTPSAEVVSQAPKATLPAVASRYKTLDKPFTLVYDYTYENVETKAMKDWNLKEREADLRKQVDEDRMSQEQMDRQVADIKRQMSVGKRSGRMTISYDGRSLLVDDSLPGPLGDHWVVILRSDRSYELFPDQPNGTNFREYGIVSLFLYRVPFVGPSLPFLTIDRGSKVLCVLSAPLAGDPGPNRLQYVPAKLKPYRDGAVKEVGLGKVDPPSSKWTLDQFQPFLGTQVSKRIVWINYNYFQDWPDQGLPRERLTFTLASATPSAMAAEMYEPEHYMAEGSVFQSHEQSDNYKSVTYSRANGTIEEQLARAKAHRP